MHCGMRLSHDQFGDEINSAFIALFLLFLLHKQQTDWIFIHFFFTRYNTSSKIKKGNESPVNTFTLSPSELSERRPHLTGTDISTREVKFLAEY